MPINNKENKGKTFPLLKPETLKQMLGGGSQKKADAHKPERKMV